MNERIKELLEEAGVEVWYDESSGQTVFSGDNIKQLEKFAMLVIEDCIDCVDGYTKPRTFDTHYDAVEQIKHLFGVE